MEPQLQNVVRELRSEAAAVSHLPLFVDDLERNVFVPASTKVAMARLCERLPDGGIVRTSERAQGARDVLSTYGGPAEKRRMANPGSVGVMVYVGVLDLSIRSG